MAFTETEAKRTMLLAIQSQQCAEMLNTLMDGGGFTFDPNTGRFIMTTPAMIQEILDAANREAADD